MTPWYVFAAAFLMDLKLGDPYNLPHPVRLMGKAIDRGEALFRILPLKEKTAGILFALFMISGTFFTGLAIVSTARNIDPLVGRIVEIILLYFCLSVRSLEKAAMEVHDHLEAGEIQEARNHVSMIVGRDTQQLDSDGICRAAIETVAENLSDGVIAPLFFAAVGGVPSALAYKMTNTLDSMVGYKVEPYIDFGMASAKIDDIANFIPARLSALFIVIAAATRKGSKKALLTTLKEGRNHASPNAGYPEAAVAGALGIKINGPNRYFGKIVEKPFIGVEFPFPKPFHIKETCRLMLISSALFVSFCCILSAILQ